MQNKCLSKHKLKIGHDAAAQRPTFESSWQGRASALRTACTKALLIYLEEYEEIRLRICTSRSQLLPGIQWCKSFHNPVPNLSCGTMQCCSTLSLPATDSAGQFPQLARSLEWDIQPGQVQRKIRSQTKLSKKYVVQDHSQSWDLLHNWISVIILFSLFHCQYKNTENWTIILQIQRD